MSGMSIYDEFASDAAEVFSEFGKEVVIGAQRLPALISESQETLELGAGGFSASGNFTIKLLRLVSRICVSKVALAALQVHDKERA